MPIQYENVWQHHSRYDAHRFLLDPPQTKVFPDALVAFTQGLQGFHGTEVFDVSCMKVNLDHSGIIPVVKQSEEGFTRREEECTHNLVDLHARRIRANA